MGFGTNRIVASTGGSINYTCSSQVCVYYSYLDRLHLVYVVHSWQDSFLVMLFIPDRIYLVYLLIPWQSPDYVVLFQEASLFMVLLPRKIPPGLCGSLLKGFMLLFHTRFTPLVYKCDIRVSGIITRSLRIW